MKSKRKIQSIQALRGIASVLVVLCHTSFTSFGAFAVDFFLVISGFVIMYSTQTENKSFWMRRIVKIIPLYWFMTIITAIFVFFLPQLFNSYEVSAEYLVKSLFFIPYEHSGIQQPILGLAWTLNYEMLFYVIFWIAMKISHKLRGWITIVVCMVITVIGITFNDLPMPFSYWTDSIILEFCFGIFVYWMYEKISEKCKDVKEANTNIYTVFNILIVSIGSIIMNVFLISNLPRFITVGGVAALILLCFLRNEERIRWNKGIVYLGNISYVLYLIHIYPVRLTERICGSVIENKVVCACMAVVIAVICAVLWNKTIEVPVQRKLSEIIRD